MVVVEEFGGYEFTGFHEMEKWKKESSRTYKENAVSALHVFRLEPVRSSETRGRSSEQASIYEDHCQKPVRSSETQGRSSEQASVCEGRSQKPVRSSEQWVSSSEQVSGCSRSSELFRGSSK